MLLNMTGRSNFAFKVFLTNGEVQTMLSTQSSHQTPRTYLAEVVRHILELVAVHMLQLGLVQQVLQLSTLILVNLVNSND